MNMDVDVVPTNGIVRQQLGSVVVSVPQPAQVKKFATPDGVPYEQFDLSVSGGYIHFHLFDREKCVARGKKLWVEAQVWMKTMPDGMQFLYVDLHPTDKPLTHDRKIFQRQQEVPAVLPEGSLRFNTFGHIRGSLVFVPRDLPK
jgi:hypothetical protein